MAPIQINTWGHSDTSGNRAIDYYMSSKYFELSDYEKAQSHYSEKLILLDSLCTYYYHPEQITHFKRDSGKYSRKQLDLPGKNKTISTNFLACGIDIYFLSIKIYIFDKFFRSEISTSFEENGFLVLPELFQPHEVNEINDASREIFSENNPANIIESKSGEARTAMGLHLRHKLFRYLVRDPRLLEPAFQLSGEKFYVQQVKINVKSAFEGEQWQWHYDFATHHNDDGVPKFLALNLHIFLDDVNHFNGPLYFIPGFLKKGPALS